MELRELIDKTRTAAVAAKSSGYEQTHLALMEIVKSLEAQIDDQALTSENFGKGPLH